MASKTPVSPGFCLGLAAMLLLVPLPWLFAMVFAAVFHELCHCCAIRLFGSRSDSLRVYTFGAQLSLPPMSRGQELFCTLAGPAGSFLLCCLIRWFPRVAICAAGHLVFNLLPLYPLDGGRALCCILTVIFPPSVAGKILRAVEWMVCILIFALGCYAWIVLRAGLLPVLFGGMLFFRFICGKIPCKPARMGVQ